MTIAVERHPRAGYPLMPEDERIIIALGGQAPSCLTCCWSQGGGYSPPVDSWLTMRCERRYLELLDGENVRWPGGAAPYRNDHRDDAACGAGTKTSTEWISRLRMNAVTKVPADRYRHDRWWQDQYPRLGEGGCAVAHPPCVHWRTGPRPSVADLWDELDRGVARG